MRISTFPPLLLPILTAANVLHFAAPPIDFLVAVTVQSLSATAASIPTLSTPVVTSVSISGIDRFELKPRQGGAPINPEPIGIPNPAVPVPGINPDPAIPSAVPPVPEVIPPQPAPAVPGVVPEVVPKVVPEVVPEVTPGIASPTILPVQSTTPISQRVTVQWMETWIHSTSSTWVPVTFTIVFDSSLSKAPEPGRGVIGMGTLTGETGKTKTIVVGAAPTKGAEWLGLCLAVGMAVVGAAV